MSELEEFHRQLIADIQGDADALGLVTVEAFFEKVGDLLTETGELESAGRAFFEGTVSGNTARVDGYGGDPRDADGVLSLVLCDFDLSDELRSIDKRRIMVLLKQTYRFLKACRSRDFRDGLEETSAAFGLADLISTTWRNIEKIKIVILSNAESKTQADAIKVTDFKDKPITLSVWDLKRLRQFMEQGQARANLLIDFQKDFGGAVPLLAASGGENALESYLAVIPGKQLALIYDKWGPRLLEANVRSFLQARSKVNRGIRDTIRDEPDMFFPYNNGLSATAEGIDVSRSDSGLELTRADNLQIVNGGQTTASLHAALKLAPTQLESVHVQMKLTIVPAERTELIVPKISEFANTQNKVNAADFFANHPFHIQAETLSRRVLAPAGQDGYRETKWFYERARGQYADERGRRSIPQRKQFDAEFPRSQFFTKTDLAKYENTFACLPQVVSLGAQKNFGEFAGRIGKLWGKKGKGFNDTWFKRLIAKCITFRATEKLVSAAVWYQGGYRANIVTYSIAKVVHDAEARGMVVDLDRIWRTQEVPEDLKAALEIAGAEAQDVISNPPDGVRNFSEWAKKPMCWKWMSERALTYEEGFDSILTTTELADEEVQDEMADEAMDKSVAAEIEVYQLGAEFWAEARNWARERGLLSPRETGILETCAAMPHKLPTEKQCDLAIGALKKLHSEGFAAGQSEADS